jgi:hypothetical protein
MSQLRSRLKFVGKGDAATSPQLVEMTIYHKELRYVPLSHRWGTQPTFPFTQQTTIRIAPRSPSVTPSANIPRSDFCN